MHIIIMLIHNIIDGSLTVCMHAWLYTGVPVVTSITWDMIIVIYDMGHGIINYDCVQVYTTL